MAQATVLTRATPNRRTTVQRAGRARAAALVTGVLLLLVGPFGAPAGAHADVVAFSPGPAEVLDRSPDSVRIWFSEGVDPTLGGVFVYDGDGNRVDARALRQPSPEKLVLPLDGALDDGTYIVTWRAVSEDTHAIQGTWTFHIGSPSASTANADAVAAVLLRGQEADRAVAVAWGVARWVVFASMALLVGGAVFSAAIWPRARDARAARGVVAGGWVGLTVATLLGLVLFGAYSSGATLPGAFDPDVLRDTLDLRFGHVGLLRLGLLAVAIVLGRVLFARHGDDPHRLPAWWSPTAAVTGLALVATPGLAGHASAGDHRVLALVADTLHVAAMAVWLGGLVLLAAAVLARDDADAIRVASRRFSRVALGCVVVLVVTGAFQTWRVVGGLSALRDDEYGRILVVKLVIFALLLVVASFGREIVERLFPRVPVVRGAAIDLAEAPVPDGRDDASERARELRTLRRSVWGEVVLGAAVLVATALLVNAAPPRGGAAREGASGVTIAAAPLTLEVTAAPGVAGLNDLHVNTSSPDGAPLDVAAVELQLALPARDLAPLDVPLRQLGPGHYLSPGLDIPLAGTWTVRAVIRLGPVDRADLTGELEIR